MELICYLHKGWQPLIRPAPASREWMDNTQHSFAYRCLPLSIANSHGWELLSPCEFEARWNGGNDLDDVILDIADNVPQEMRPQSMFGHGTFTFHVMGLFRTPPGWNLWIGGSPNSPKDGVYPLTGIIETDWSPYTFTMNWKFTQRNRTVRFKQGEPIGFFFPLPRKTIEEVKPIFVPIESNPDLMQQFADWSKSRDAHRALMEREPAKNPSDQWQKKYYRGLDMHDKPGVPDHRAKVRPQSFQPGKPTQENVGSCPFHGGQMEDKTVIRPSTKLPARFVSKPDPFGDFNLHSNAASLGEAIRTIADGFNGGKNRSEMLAKLLQLGLTQDHAQAVLSKVFSGSPRLL